MITRSARGRDARRQPTATRGQIMIMFAAGLLLLVGIVAMAIDVGFLMAERRQVQNAADAGALAAAKAKLDYLTDMNRPTIEITTGKQYGAENAGTVEDNVDVDPDPEGYSDDYVEVEVTKDVQSFFIQALYNGDWRVSASAVAGMEPVQRPYALLALGCGPGNQPGIQIDGGGTIDVNEGSIMSNCGIGRSGQSNIVTADGAIDAHGDIDAGDQWHAGDGINEDRPEVTDPVADQGITPPTIAMATSQPNGVNVPDEDDIDDAISNLTHQNSAKYRCDSGNTCVMQPGYYGDNFTVTVQDGTLRMEPGIYYFGDRFTIQGQSDNATIVGTDVVLYFDDESFFNPDHATIDLAAPDNSPYGGGLDGMLLWISEDNCMDFSMKANGDFNLDGVFYGPCSHVELYGSPGAKGFQVVVQSLELEGGNNFEILYKEYVKADMPHVFLVQ